nr:chorismate pyruvate-lyase family protein [Actinomycetota bacterium]
MQPAPGLELLGDHWEGLSALQRILLTTDGTLTTLVEVYADEPIKVAKLDQSLGLWEGGDAGPALSLHPDEAVLRRAILLQGSSSHTNYLYAESLIVPDRLQPHVRTGLVETDKPIGRLLLEARTETFREILAGGTEPARGCADHFGIGQDDLVIFRTYNVIADQRPIMMITEKFPIGAF